MPVASIYGLWLNELCAQAQSVKREGTVYAASGRLNSGRGK